MCLQDFYSTDIHSIRMASDSAVTAIVTVYSQSSVVKFFDCIIPDYITPWELRRQHPGDHRARNYGGGERACGRDLPRDWMDREQVEGHEFLHEVTQVKNIWVPTGE